jgi:hypothetical protein
VTNTSSYHPAQDATDATLTHCFRCGENFNNIDLMMLQGHDFLPAVDILKSWLEEYRRDLGRGNAPVDSNNSV